MAIRGLGAYTPEIRRDTAEGLFEAVREYGFTEAQFNFSSVLGEELPPTIPSELIERIGSAARENYVEITAINGTFNMIHPDEAVRAEGIARFSKVAKACSALGCPMLTLCTGSRNRESMWRRHDESLTEDAWADLMETASKVAAIAERYGLMLGVETEASNAVNTPERARRFLDELRSDRFGIILDPANLFQMGQANPANVRAILDRAFDLLGDSIIAAHGKDILPGPGLAFTGAGQGIVDFDHMLALLRRCGYAGGIVIHGIKRESDIPASVAFMRDKLARE